jgi:ABC-type amino acid transport substrate-binding protein
MSEAWPAGVPQTLWHYRDLQPNNPPQIPMMGVQFGQQFLIAFVVGLLFITYFAWDRFNQQSSAPDFRYRVMKEVDVADLGGTGARRQAYLIYLTTLLFLYVAMTFFGKLIIQTLNELRIVGIQVDASSLQFDSPQWPLMLAFGFAGLAPLIPQLQIAEGWLFQRAYRTVGIPVRINETTRNLVSLLDAAAADELIQTKPLNEALERKRATIREKIDPTWLQESLTSSKIDDGLNVLAQLELLIGWAKGKRGNWPGSEVSDTVRDKEQNIAGQAGELLDGFERRVRGPVSSGEGKAAIREKYVVETVGRARELRDELTAILAVYVERDPRCVEPSANSEELVRDPSLRALLQTADPPNLAGTGPEFGVLICILITIPIYALFTWKELHPPLSSSAMADSLRVVLATAGLYALLFVSIFWFPLLGAFAMRQYYYDERRWIAIGRHNDRSSYAKQRLAVVGVAFVISVICLSGVAALWAFLIARDVINFQALLIGRGVPFLLYYPSLALITIPLIWFTLIAVDTRIDDRPALRYGILSGILVFACLTSHLYYWYKGAACTNYPRFLTDLFSGGCFFYYEGLNFFVMPILAFLAAVVFGNPQPASFAIRRSRLTPRGLEQAALALAVAVLISTFCPVALAQETKNEKEINTPNKKEVKIGFRDAIEPFSYKASVDGGTRIGLQPLYRGFLADLCYWIFEGGDYSVAEVPVTASDRFQKLREGEIDVLCDPVTMRFSEFDPVTYLPRENIRIKSGIFSPIVFATGISYLQRRNRQLGSPVYIGYVKDTTATDVLSNLCKFDFFGIVLPKERTKIPAMCQTASIADNASLQLRETNNEVERAAKEAEDLVSRLGNEASGSQNRWKKWNDQVKTCYELGRADCIPDGLLEELKIRCKAPDANPGGVSYDNKGSQPDSPDTRCSEQVAKLAKFVTQLKNKIPVLQDVERMVDAEKRSVERHRDEASGPQKTQYEQSLRMWEETLNEIKSCQEGTPSCRPKWILQRFGDSCDETRSQPDGRTGDGQNSNADKSGWRRTAYRFCSFDSYKDAIDWFCDPSNSEKGMVYLGDREIILGKLQTWNEDHYARCIVENEDGGADLSYEAYALMVAKPSSEERQKVAELVQRRVYEFFSFSALAREKFDTYFLGPKKDRRMSTALAFLFLLNGVEDERHFTFPAKEATESRTGRASLPEP